jgi:ABC-2 type transport system ATP-binding protein
MSAERSEPAPAPVIEVRHLVKRFGAFVSVDDLNLSVAPGEVFGLLGSNGAGKTTAIRMLCGLLTPTAGSARVLGLDVGRDPEAVKRRIGYMTQRFSLYDDLTVSQNIRFFGGVYGLRGQALREREDWAVGMAGLEGRGDILTRSLPGGWKQRLALACSVLHGPRVLFLDEPTGGVDPISRRRFWNLIDAMAGDGVTIIVTTHYLDEAERCDRIALMHAGRLIALGTVGELKEVFAGRALIEVSCPRVLEAQERLEREDWVIEASVFGARLHLVVADVEEGKRRARETLGGNGFAPLGVERILPSLEDVFIHCIETEDAARAGRPA